MIKHIHSSVPILFINARNSAQLLENPGFHPYVVISLNK